MRLGGTVMSAMAILSVLAGTAVALGNLCCSTASRMMAALASERAASVSHDADAGKLWPSEQER